MRPSPSRSPRLATALTLLLALAAPAASQRPATAPTDPASPLLNQGPKAEAVADRGMVSTQLASSTLAALDVLRQGGNAVDAALTALFVQQVHDYHMVFLFGSMSALVYDAKTGTYHALNAVAARPRADRSDRGDAAKVAIGGTVRGAAELARRFGTRPWASYLQPAIAAAEEGAVVTSFMYGLNFALWESGFLGDLRDNPEARAFYMPDGHLIGVGHRWKMPALARTMRRVAEDPDFMYTGEWGQKFVKAAQGRGGRVTMEDMAEYRPTWSEPTKFTYRGRTIYGSPPPDAGGLEVGYSLNILENFDLAGTGHYSRSPETLEIMARAFGRVRQETSSAIRDPLAYRLPERLWLAKDYGKMGAEYVRETMPRVSFAAPPARAGEVSPSRPEEPPPAELGSNHIVVADKEGNWVSLLHTIHGGAPGVFVDGVRATGSQFGGATAGPGRRLVLPITAIMIAGENGKPWLAMGTPGNPPQPVTQVLVNLIDFKMDPREAADAPRFWAFRQGESVEMETRISDQVRAGLEARGIKLVDLGPYNYHTGSMQIVWRDERGRLHGVTDARRLGHAAGH